MTAPKAPDAQPIDLRRIGLAVFSAMAIILAVDAVRSMIGLSLIQPMGIDFLPLWSAGSLAFHHTDRVYDFGYVTQMQDAIVHARPGARPFIYPPTALLLFATWSHLTFSLANIMWVTLTAAAAVVMTAVAAGRSRLLAAVMLILAPGCVIVAAVGQTTFVMMALATLGTFGLKRYPWLAGIALGVAASLKPSTLILAPLCLIAAKEWRALGGALIAGLAVGVVALIAFGVDPWFAWLAALPDFHTLVMSNPGLVRNMVTPTAAAMKLGLDGGALIAVQVVVGLTALVLALIVFQRSQDWTARMVVMVGGGLLIAPYAMAYEGVLVGPAVVVFAATNLNTRRWPLALAAYLLLDATSLSYVAPYAMMALVGLTAALAWRDSRPA